MIKRERSTELFFPKDIGSLDRDVQTRSDPPEGWLTLLGICRIFHPDRADSRTKSLKRIVFPLAKIHPEWMGRFAGNGPKGLRVHYSPDMINAVAQALGNPQRVITEVGAENNTGISFYQRGIEKTKQRQNTLTYLMGKQSVQDAELDYSKVLELVRDKRGAVHWKDMEGNPALLATVLKNEIQTLISKGFNVSGRIGIIGRYYPGGWCINGRWGNKISAPYFSGSVMVAKIKSFSPWGISFSRLDQADRTSGIYFDGQFEWANAKYFQRTVGITHRPIRASLKGISTITVEDRARRSGLFYRIDEAMAKLSPYRVLPMTDKKNGRYTNESGVSFVARRTLAREYNLDYGKVKSLAKNCSYIDGKDSSGHPVPLYKEKELVNRIEAFLRLPQVDKESKMYIDGEGESWATTGFIHDKYHISQGQSRRYFKDILQTNGRTARGKQIHLYNLQQAVALIESIQGLPVVDKKTGRYVDDGGQIWINVNTFSREKGVDHTSLANRLSNSVCLQGRSVSGSRCALYREEDIIRVVNERNHIQTISPQDADEELGRLIR